MATENALGIEGLTLYSPEEVGKAPSQQKKTSVPGAIAEFLVPTTKGVLTGEKPVNAKTLAGSALEVGSFLIPGGAMLKGAATGVRTLSKAEKAAEVAKSLYTGAKSGLKIGALSGGMTGAGRELGNEESTAGSVAAEAGIGSIVGGIGGSIFGTIASPVSTIVKNTLNTARAIKEVAQKAPEVAKQASDTLTKAYTDSFTSIPVLKGLNKIVLDARKRGGPDSIESLFREFADEGFIPEFLEDGVVRTQRIQDTIQSQVNQGMGEVKKLLEPIKTRVSISQIYDKVVADVLDDVTLDTQKALTEVGTLFNSFKRKYGDELLPVDVNDLRIRMNKATKAFKPESFSEDVKNIIGGQLRDVLDEVVPDEAVRRMNAQISKLQRLKGVAKTIDFKKVDAGMMEDVLGKYVGTVAPALIGGGAIGTLVNPVIGIAAITSGIVSNMAPKMIRQWVSKSRFDPILEQAIQGAMKSDKTIYQRVIDAALPEDKERLINLFKGLDTPSILK